MASRVVSAVQMGFIGLALGGDQILPLLGVNDPPQLYTRMRENKLQWVMGAWFVGNMVQNSLTSSGAFEIFYDGKLVRIAIQILSVMHPDRCTSVLDMLIL